MNNRIVAWCVESTHSGDELERELFLRKEDAEKHLEGNGGVLVALVDEAGLCLAEQKAESLKQERDLLLNKNLTVAAGVAAELDLNAAREKLGELSKLLKQARDEWVDPDYQLADAIDNALRSEDAK